MVWNWNWHWINIELKLNCNWIEIEFTLNWNLIEIDLKFKLKSSSSAKLYTCAHWLWRSGSFRSRAKTRWRKEPFSEWSLVGSFSSIWGEVWRGGAPRAQTRNGTQRTDTPFAPPKTSETTAFSRFEKAPICVQNVMLAMTPQTPPKWVQNRVFYDIFNTCSPP